MEGLFAVLYSACVAEVNHFHSASIDSLKLMLEKGDEAEVY